MRGAQKSGFWSCAEKKFVFCCSDYTGPFGDCAHCETSSGCRTGDRLVPVDCPTNIPSGHDLEVPDMPEIHCTLTNEDGFHDDLLNTYGIDRKMGQDRQTGFPVPGDIVVSDPKALIADNADNIAILSSQMVERAFWADWGGGFSTHT
ncbi:uncharacterized protein B0I36DRAFT_345084 [Microdochium trichocladiopsis]|uniref:Uncharacterized protein n=1 Tax=Microdochium trichocladiopsis TaxID=1682393 RepID=A0A9P9BX56_9PEZI|nr:uncharacterized protein B0I36DRAFT_345084 [Microdochium trichocladiopsis]KAH7041487.1 hypothetical protein B0I36DRAFT_345084 [Microdochium trichocladiopsis]